MLNLLLTGKLCFLCVMCSHFLIIINVYIYIPIITIPIQCSDTCHDMPSSIYEATLIPSVAAVAYGGSDAVGMCMGPVSPSAGVQMLNLMAKHNLR